jgi:hypothetical protein
MKRLHWQSFWKAERNIMARQNLKKRLARETDNNKATRLGERILFGPDNGWNLSATDPRLPPHDQRPAIEPLKIITHRECRQLRRDH